MQKNPLKDNVIFCIKIVILGIMGVGFIGLFIFLLFPKSCLFLIVSVVSGNYEDIKNFLLHWYSNPLLLFILLIIILLIVGFIYLLIKIFIYLFKQIFGELMNIIKGHFEEKQAEPIANSPSLHLKGKVCPKCSIINREESNFCGDCGEALFKN